MKKILYGIFVLVLMLIPTFICGCASDDYDSKPSKYYTITTSTNNSEYGNVIGGGIYEEGKIVQIKAIARNNYYLDNWGTEIYEISPTLTIKVEKDMEIVANFEMGKCVYNSDKSKMAVVKDSDGYNSVDYENGKFDFMARSNTFAYWYNEKSGEPISSSKKYEIRESEVDKKIVLASNDNKVGFYAYFDDNSLIPSNNTALSEIKSNEKYFKDYFYYIGNVSLGLNYLTTIQNSNCISCMYWEHRFNSTSLLKPYELKIGVVYEADGQRCVFFDEIYRFDSDYSDIKEIEFDGNKIYVLIHQRGN